MHLQIPASVRNRLQLAAERLKLRARERLVCRECGHQVGLLADVCDSCGAGSPVKVNVRPGVLVAAVAALALVVTLCLW
jgi:hypothetical protein